MLPLRILCRAFLTLVAIIAAGGVVNHAQVIITQPLPFPRVWSWPGKEDFNKARVRIECERLETPFRYYTEDGTAKAGVDYIAVSGVGTNSAEVEITVLNDGKVESIKTLKLVAIEESVSPRTNWTEVVIFDDEIPRSVDTSFRTQFTPLTPGFTLGVVDRLVSGRVLADGTIVVVEPSGFTVVNADGTLRSRHTFREGANYEFWASAVTPAGNVLSARPTEIYHESISLREWSLVQYLPSGENDASFVPQLPPARINGFTVAPDGKILVSITDTNQPSDWSILRLHANGSLDSGFAAIHGPTGEASAQQHIAVRPDGSVEVITPGAFWRRRVYKNSDLVEDLTSYVIDVRLQPKMPEMSLRDGLVMDATPPIYVNYLETTSLYRIRADGSLDESFVSGLLSTQFAYIGTQPDGRVVVFDNGQLKRLNTASEQSNYVSVVVVNAQEESPEGVVRLQRTGDTTQPRTVRLQTSDGSAKAGVDYAALDTLLTFEPSKAVANVPITMIDDAVSDWGESFVLKLSAPQNDVVIETAEFPGAIYDQEPYIYLQIQRREDGALLVWKNFEPQWNVALQSSADLGRTWTDISSGTGSSWIILPDPTSRAVIFRVVKRE
jgi:hypothetical protein